jgi:hypothetical protein
MLRIGVSDPQSVGDSAPEPDLPVLFALNHDDHPQGGNLSAHLPHSRFVPDDLR